MLLVASFLFDWFTCFYVDILLKLRICINLLHSDIYDFFEVVILLTYGWEYSHNLGIL